jgi:hypothetical protein
MAVVDQMLYCGAILAGWQTGGRGLMFAATEGLMIVSAD